MQPTPPDDKDLLALFTQGDTKAFEIIFKRYYPALCHFAYTFLHDKDSAEEVVQAMFTNIWERRKELNINTSLKAYLYMAVRNRSLNVMRRQSSISELDTDNEHNDIADDDSDTGIDDYQIQQALQMAVDKLPPRCGQIFRMCKFDGLSYREIAEFLDISPKTVDAQMGIALRNLRSMLHKFYSRMSVLFLSVALLRR